MAAQLIVGALSHFQMHIAGAQTMLQHIDCRALFAQPTGEGGSGSSCGAASSSTHESRPLTELMAMHALTQTVTHAQQQRRQQQLPHHQSFKRHLPISSLAQQLQQEEDELDSPPLPFSRPLQRSLSLQSGSPPALPVAAKKTSDDADAAWESQNPAPEPLGQQLNAEDLASLKGWLSTPPTKTGRQRPQVDTRSNSDSSDDSCSSSDESSSSEDEAAETAAAELALLQLPRQHEAAVQASIVLTPVYSAELSAVHLPQLGRTTVEHYAALGRLSSDSQGAHDDVVLFMSRPQLRGATCATGLITPSTISACADGGSQADAKASATSDAPADAPTDVGADAALRLYESQERTIAAANDGALTSSTASTAAWLARWKAKQRKARRSLQLTVNSKASVFSSSSIGAVPSTSSSPLSPSEWTMLG
jgi:hypothetical protein